MIDSSNHLDYLETNGTESLLSSGSHFTANEPVVTDIYYDIIGDVQEVSEISLTVNKVNEITVVGKDENGVSITRVSPI